MATGVSTVEAASQIPQLAFLATRRASWAAAAAAYTLMISRFLGKRTMNVCLHAFQVLIFYVKNELPCTY